MKPGFTHDDPQFEVICEHCRYGDHDHHVKDIEVPEPSRLAGKYRCACTRCRA